jgi:photosynthetic reaction center cytochrome c subunit
MFKARVRRSLCAAMWGLASIFLIVKFLAPHSYADTAAAQDAQAPSNQTAPAPGAQAEPPAEQVFKNIQVLKGIPASQLKRVMTLISTSVGMRCDQCHVPDAYEKDDKRAKQTGRQMIQLVLDVNKNSFDGQTQVTCYSCHRGQQRPVATPPLRQAAAPSPPAPGPRPASAGLPTYDQIIDKYLQAIGSSAAYEKLKSRVMKGSMVDSRGETFPVEVYQASPDKIVTITTLPNGIAAQGFNGAIGWVSGPSDSAELKGLELAQIKRAADIARALKIKEESLSPRVNGKVTIGEKEAYLVSARADGQRVQLYFDVQTGLLLRRVVSGSTRLGSFPEQTDFDDYREVDGVKLPFKTRYSTPNPAAGTTIEFKEITHNVPLDDAKFNPPPIQK